ncbi:MAG TPA: hypothetical protein VF212_02320 [Longimicrobiales bacterium]
MVAGAAVVFVAARTGARLPGARAIRLVLGGAVVGTLRIVMSS